MSSPASAGKVEYRPQDMSHRALTLGETPEMLGLCERLPQHWFALEQLAFAEREIATFQRRQRSRNIWWMP